jgi:predicted ATPase
MNKTTVEELKKIYRDKVLPKKSVLKGTPESCLKTLEIYEEFVPLRKQANEEVTNYAMQAAFVDDFEELVFPPASDQRIQMRILWKSLKREQSTAELSDGTLRFLFLLTVMASPSPAPIIAIDEPETGLHPSMLPLVAEYAVDAATRSQVILTTHSPQFLDAFVETKPTTTVAKWEHGETILHTLKEEELDYWLKEYSLGSLFKSGELEQMG